MEPPVDANDPNAHKGGIVAENRGSGGDLFPKERDGHERETLRLLNRAVRCGWPVTGDGMRRAVEQVEAIIDKGQSDRETIAAAKVLVSMRASNIEGLALLDKLERLDGGEATDRIEFGPMKF